MRKITSLFLLLFSLVSLSAMADTTPPDSNLSEPVNALNFRLDCRFYDTTQHGEPRHCVSDATYTAYFRGPSSYQIGNIHYGVRCDRETIYANQGTVFATTDPVTHTTEDHIRPLTSAVPETVLLFADALTRAGTYTANLYLDEKKMTDGSCDVQLLNPRPL